jgi:hypothetical protein
MTFVKCGRCVWVAIAALICGKNMRWLKKLKLCILSIMMSLHRWRWIRNEWVSVVENLLLLITTWHRESDTVLPTTTMYPSRLRMPLHSWRLGGFFSFGIIRLVDPRACCIITRFHHSHMLCFGTHIRKLPIVPGVDDELSDRYHNTNKHGSSEKSATTGRRLDCLRRCHFRCKK